MTSVSRCRRRPSIQYIGPDIFHPSPEFLFAPGAGPLFDIGPYYLTTLIQVFGSVRSVAAVGSRSRTTRTIQAGGRAGTVFDVQVPTHVSAIASFVDGGVSQSVFSFDSPLTRMGYVEITGTEGTIVIPDPNLLHRRGQDHPGARRSPRSPRIRSGRACRCDRRRTQNGASGCSTWLGRPGPAAEAAGLR